MSVFTVSIGDFYDYKLLGIFSTKENAEKYIKTFNIGEIEETQLDEQIKNIPDNHQLFQICIQENGDILSVEIDTGGEVNLNLNWINYYSKKPNSRLGYLSLLAKDATDAKELAINIYKTKID